MKILSQKQILNIVGALALILLAACGGQPQVVEVEKSVEVERVVEATQQVYSDSQQSANEVARVEEMEEMEEVAEVIEEETDYEVKIEKEVEAESAPLNAGADSAAGEVAHLPTATYGPQPTQAVGASEDDYEPRPTPAPTRPAEPSAMFFEEYGVNPFIDTRDDNLSTFAIDVDTGSYSVARRYINDGFLPPEGAVRVEEFVNYFDHQYDAPEDRSFAIHLEAAPAPYGENENYHLLRVGVQGYEVADEERPDAMLIFVIDTSGSMAAENRLGLVKESLHMLTDNLRPSDQIGIVVYGSRGRVILEPTAARNSWEIHRAIDRLEPEGSTNADEGLMLAYDLAEQYGVEGNINRLILTSDGVANVGPTTADAILRHATTGIQLSTFGYGMGNYNDVLMEQLADKGDGSYAYIDTLDEAERVFEDQLLSTILTIAKDAKIQVEFNPNVVESYRLIGYENRDVADADFRNDAVDAGEIGAGHSVTALYEVRFAAEANRNEAAVTARLRYADIIFSEEVVELAETMAIRDVYASMSEAPATFQLSAVVVEFAELLRGSYWARESSLDDVAIDARRIAKSFDEDGDVQEFTQIVSRAANLFN